MATPRRPLAPLNNNIIRGPELTPYERGKIVGLSLISLSRDEIAAELKISPNTVWYTLDQTSKRQDGKSVPRAGRPRILNVRDERTIICLIRANPFISYGDIRAQTQLTASNSTLLRMLKRSGYGHWRAKNRPKLLVEHAKIRLDWALKRRDWSVERWRMIIFSDECSVEIGKGKGNKWCFRLNHANEKWKKENIQTYSKSKQISIMIWGAIWGGGCSEINLLTRDFESARNGYSAKSYLKILEANLFSIYSPELTFMQDNAPIHTARIVKKWFDDNDIQLLAWPPYSPDLNPIEHAWARLKEDVHKRNPELEELKASKELITDLFSKAIEAAWSEISQDYFDRLVESMPRRVEAVIAAEGWYTKY